MPVVAAVRLDTRVSEGRSGRRRWCGGLVLRRSGLSLLAGLASCGVGWSLSVRALFILVFLLCELQEMICLHSGTWVVNVSGSLAGLLTSWFRSDVKVADMAFFFFLIYEFSSLRVLSGKVGML